MSKIKVSELFYALQGEGRYVGTPSVFLRTFGCNLRCKNFGRSKEHIEGPNPEVAEVIKNIGLYKKLTDLPLVPTGCDSYAAVYPEFKGFSPTRDTKELASEILSMTSKGRLDAATHLVITGGEPLLWQKQLADLVDELDETNSGFMHITFETNGTQSLDTGYIEAINYASSLHFSVSPKLSCSGESRKDAINPNVIRQMVYQADEVDFKFVVATKEDMEEVVDILNTEFAEFSEIPVYLMPVGGLNEDYQLNRTDVSNFALKYGMKFSPRLQCDVSGNSWGT